MEVWIADNYKTILIILAGSGLVFGFGKWFQAVNSDRETFKTFMTEVRADLKEILLRSSRVQTASTASPVQLTDFGRQISRELDVGAWVTAEVEALLARVQGLPEHEMYDLCIDHVQGRIDEDKNLHATIRASAYQHGIDMVQVQRVYVIELRDALLNRRAD